MSLETAIRAGMTGILKGHLEDDILSRWTEPLLIEEVILDGSENLIPDFELQRREIRENEQLKQRLKTPNEFLLENSVAKLNRFCSIWQGEIERIHEIDLSQTDVRWRVTSELFREVKEKYFN